MTDISTIIESASHNLPSGGGGVRRQVSAEVKALRGKLGLTQKGFAERFGIPLASIQNWESEARKSNPDATAMLLLAMIKADSAAVQALVDKCRRGEKGNAWPDLLSGYSDRRQVEVSKEEA
jgi:transcriptional regulator with XRE-family HTH domain